MLGSQNLQHIMPIYDQMGRALLILTSSKVVEEEEDNSLHQSTIFCLTGRFVLCLLDTISSMPWIAIIWREEMPAMRPHVARSRTPIMYMLAVVVGLSLSPMQTPHQRWRETKASHSFAWSDQLLFGDSVMILCRGAGLGTVSRVATQAASVSPCWPVVVLCAAGLVWTLPYPAFKYEFHQSRN
jgi:hypothetical protein